MRARGAWLLPVLLLACGQGGEVSGAPEPDAAGNATTSAPPRPADEGSPSGLRGEPDQGRPPAPPLSLVDQHGEPFRLADQAGHLVLLSFGFVHCPDVCPATLSTWSRVRAELGERAALLRGVFVTVDPERDTPERLAQHLSLFDPGFLGLTGTPQELQAVYDAYDIFREEVRFGTGTGSYVVDHTTATLLVDTRGRLRARYDFDTPAEDILHDVRMLLP